MRLQYRISPRGRPGAARSVVVGLIGLLILGNGFHTLRFFRDGRGGYSAALALMAERSPGGRIEVGSDHAALSGFYWAVYRNAAPRELGLRSSTTTPKP